MADIKIKKKGKQPIKKFDRAMTYTKKLKDNLIEIKDKTNYNNDEESSSTEYGGNLIREDTRVVFHKGTDMLNKYGKKSVKNTAENIQKATQKIKKKVAQKSIRTAEKGTKETIKTTKKTIKTAKKTGKVAYKTAKNTAKATVKTTKKGIQVAKQTAKATAKAIKVGIKATITAVKAIIAGTKALISAIIAGGWIAIVIIVVICLIALICSSVFGIFFSNDKSVNSGKTMSSVVREINTEFTNKITEIQKNNAHDDYEINSNKAQWKDVLAIYSVLVTNGKEQSDVITMDDKKEEKLKKVFWEMNTISSRVSEEEKEIEIIEDDGSTKKEKVKRKVLYIEITSKSVEEMIEKYKLNNKQKEQLAEIRKEEYSALWSSVIYGTSLGSNDIVAVALAQVGNVGGQPFWSWYGFQNRVEWCACFVSWCANECGYIENGIIPKFANCENEGVAWFKTCGLWQNGGYSPQSRRYNLF